MLQVKIFDHQILGLSKEQRRKFKMKQYLQELNKTRMQSLRVIFRVGACEAQAEEY